MQERIAYIEENEIFRPVWSDPLFLASAFYRKVFWKAILINIEKLISKRTFSSERIFRGCNIESISSENSF